MRTGLSLEKIPAIINRTPDRSRNSLINSIINTDPYLRYEQ